MNRTHHFNPVFPEPMQGKPTTVGLLLLENFSLPCFTQALNVLVTANSVRPGAVKVHTFSHDHTEVMSDLAIPVRPNMPLTDIRLSTVDLMIVCGGLRAPRVVPPWLAKLLRQLTSFPMALDGLCNGAWGAAGCSMATAAPSIADHRSPPTVAELSAVGGGRGTGLWIRLQQPFQPLLQRVLRAPTVPGGALRNLGSV